LPFNRRLIRRYVVFGFFISREIPGLHTKVLHQATFPYAIVVLTIQSSLIPRPLDTMATGVALIGSGIFVKEEHLPAVQATPLLILKAIYSRSLASAKAVSANLSDVDLYSDDSEGRGFDELLKREDIKGVIIALVYTASLSSFTD
jgi:hypothetical protein